MGGQKHWGLHLGLDAVELVLAVEEEFGIGIDDEDAPNLVTPRLLAGYIVARLGVAGSDGAHCLSQAAFYRIRSTLIKQFGALRKEVLPASRIDSWLKGDVRRQWRDLVAAVGATQAPGLQCRKSIYYPIAVLAPLLLPAVLLINGVPLWTAILSFLILWLAGNIVAAKLADIVPAAVSTVAGLVPYVRAPRREDWSHDYVLARVIQATARQTGIPLEKINPDSHFIKDLRLD